VTVTFEARDSREILRATGTFSTYASGYRLLRCGRQWPDRVWAVEGANEIGVRWRSDWSPPGGGCWIA